mgnify:CR=1 FL=1
MEWCDNYCQHGGVCILDKDHSGLHDSHYCQWEESRGKAEGDRIMCERAPGLGIPEALIDLLRQAT